MSCCSGLTDSTRLIWKILPNRTRTRRWRPSRNWVLLMHRASTPVLSDSFPGILGIITGGSPATTGVYYEISYDREAFAPGFELRDYRNRACA